MTVQKYKDHNTNKHIHTHNHQIAVSYPTNNLLNFADVKLIRNICISTCNVYLVLEAVRRKMQFARPGSWSNKPLYRTCESRDAFQEGGEIV